MAKYLITGGCGFIGSHLADKLMAQGHHIIILDNLSTGKKENAPKAAELIIGDATDYATVEKACKGIDGCFHLAAIASVEKSITEWVKAHQVNVTATVNVFQAVSRQPHKPPVIYASSAAIYGNNPDVPLMEGSEAIPLTAYGVDKFSCELHARIAWLVHQVPTIGLRPFNIYGARQDPYSPYSGVISIFSHRIKQGLPIHIYGDGEQVRDFVYIADAVDVFITAMESVATGYDVINLCTGNPTSINDLTDVIEKYAGKSVLRQYLPPRNGDIGVSIGSPDKLYKQLRLRLVTSLEEGVGCLMEVISQRIAA